jgi:hypothetical protein
VRLAWTAASIGLASDTTMLCGIAASICDTSVEPQPDMWKVLVAEEQRRRVLQALFQDVRRAFWRAASAQRLNNDVGDNIREAQKALESSRQGENLRAPIDALRYQKALLDSLRDLEFVQQQLAVFQNRTRGLDQSAARHGLFVGGATKPEDREAQAAGAANGRSALVRNSDVREASCQVRITADETARCWRATCRASISAMGELRQQQFFGQQHLSRRRGAAERQSDQHPVDPGADEVRPARRG